MYQVQSDLNKKLDVLLYLSLIRAGLPGPRCEVLDVAGWDRHVALQDEYVHAGLRERDILSSIQAPTVVPSGNTDSWSGMEK